VAGKTYDDFLVELRKWEGSTNYTIINEYGYLGVYQMGEEALIAAGLYKGDSTPKIRDWKGEWTGKAHEMGIKSHADFIGAKTDKDGKFLYEKVKIGKREVERIAQDPSKIENARKAQDEAVKVYHKDVWRIICHSNLDIHVGETYNGIRNTESGLIAGYHLVGLGVTYKSGIRRPGLKDYLDSKGIIIPTDGNKKNPRPITVYLKALGGYEVPFKTKPRIQSPTPVRVGTSKNLGVSPALPQGVAPPQPLPSSIGDRWPWDSNTYDDGLADRWKNMMP
jgi:hypothetical protein